MLTYALLKTRSLRLELPALSYRLPPFAALASALSAVGLAIALSACSFAGSATPEDEASYESLKAAGAISITAAVTPTALNAGDEASIVATVTSTRTAVVDVAVSIRGPTGASVYAVQLSALGISTGAPIRVEDVLAIESTDPAGTYTLSVTVRHTGTGKVLLERANAAQFTVGQSPAPVGACSGTTVFCDDYTNPALASSYTLQRGTWTRASGTYTVTDTIVWERARALLAGDYTDFDVTLTGRSLGDAGFGLSYATQSIDDGFAVIVHPAQFQGVYLKELRPGQQDVNMKSYALPAQAAGQSMSLRVRRVGTAVTVWLDGTQVLTGDDGGTGRHGKLGLVLSVTDQTSGSGAEFSLLRLDSATPWGSTCTPQCSGKQCGADGCGGSCGTCGSGASCNASGQCVSCTPQCSGKQCGADGCGGSCGTCGSGASCNASGQCVITGADVFPLKVSSNGHYLVQSDGVTPFFVFADTAWSLPYFASDADVQYYLDDRKARGLTTIMMNASGWSPSAKNTHGDAPFSNNNISSPNDAYFAHVDWVIEQAASRGLFVLLCPAWMQNYSYQNQYLTAGNARGFGQYLGNHYKGFANLAWFLGGDILAKQVDVNITRQLAYGILDNDPSRLISFHDGGSAAFQNDSWYSFDMIETYNTGDTRAYTWVTDDYNLTPTKPTINAEPNYENEHGTTAYNMRQALGWNFFAGAFGLAYGAANVWNISGDWRGSLGLPGVVHASYMAAAITSRPWHLLVPDQQHNMITSGYGSYGNSSYVTAGRASDGSFGMAYLPSARSITVNMSVFNGSKTVKWFDPTNKTYTTVGTYPNSGSQSFASRPANSAGQNDWILIIE
jgi:hypothetical protein